MQIKCRSLLPGRHAGRQTMIFLHTRGQKQSNPLS